MSDQFNFNQKRSLLQLPIAKWLNIIAPLYRQFVPQKIRCRRNVQQAKLSDIELLALLCWQVDLGMTNQRCYYRFLKSLGWFNLPERSRFNRLCNRGGQLLQYL